jgi:acetylornithine deacetylase
MHMESASAIDRSYVLDLLKELVATNSVNPTLGRGPGEAAIARLLHDRLNSIGGLDVRTQPVADGRSNVIAILKGSGGGRTLMLNGHMDTVGVDGMIIDPFKPSIQNGLIHGRGACDMKGALAAMIGAVKSIVDSRIKLHGDLIFSGVVDEEYKSIGIKKLVGEYKADGAIVGEPTDMRVATAHKGFVWIEIEVKGKAAHGSVPEKGIDAIAHAAKIMSAIEKLQPELASRVHPLLGTPKIHASTIEGGTDWSIIPDRCILRLERRTIPGETVASVMIEIEQILQAIEQETPEFNAIAHSPYDMAPLETAESERIVQTAQQVLAANMGTRAPVIGLPYWTDGALLSSMGSIPTCLLGPGDISVAHSADEYITIESVFTSTRVYREIIQRYCS